LLLRLDMALRSSCQVIDDSPCEDRLMAFNEALAERIRDALARNKNIEEKKMFDGIGFLLHGNLLVGVWKDSLIVRLDPEDGDEALLGPDFHHSGRRW
jgi:hypothetical protein